MSIKKSFKKFFEKPQLRIDILYTSSKGVFAVVAFLFFLSYFFVSARYYDAVFLPLLLPFYISFVVSFIVFLSLLSFKLAYKKTPLFVIWGVCILWIIIGGFFLLPVF